MSLYSWNRMPGPLGLLRDPPLRAPTPPPLLYPPFGLMAGNVPVPMVGTRGGGGAREWSSEARGDERSGVKGECTEVGSLDPREPTGSPSRALSPFTFGSLRSLRYTRTWALRAHSLPHSSRPWALGPYGPPKGQSFGEELWWGREEVRVRFSCRFRSHVRARRQAPSLRA